MTPTGREANYRARMSDPRFFLYTRSNDLAASRRFYADLLGLPLIWDEPDAVAVIAGGVQFAIGHDPDAVPAHGWSFQPGWGHGLEMTDPPPLGTASWSIALDPDAFDAAVARLRASGVPALRAEPFWVGYWGFVVRDPMGATVELSDPVSDRNTRG